MLALTARKIRSRWYITDLDGNYGVVLDLARLADLTYRDAALSQPQRTKRRALAIIQEAMDRASARGHGASVRLICRTGGRP